jgi:hypothetical protein
MRRERNVTHEREEEYIEVLVGKPDEDLGVAGRIMLKT